MGRLNPLRLNEGAEQVASGTGQVSSSSQSLAEGASEQAASIEETVSSMAERGDVWLYRWQDISGGGRARWHP